MSKEVNKQSSNFIPCRKYMGSRNSLRTRILAENPQTFIAGCNCHFAHLAVGKGGEAYVSVTEFDCEEGSPS